MGKAQYDPIDSGHRAWNAGLKVGAKRARKPRQVWAIRFFLDERRRVRDRALFDLAIASPALANQLAGQGIDSLAGAPTLSSSGDEGAVTWRLDGPDGARQTITHHPRLSCGDFEAIHRAATAGLCVALLPAAAGGGADRSSGGAFW